jgi:hypothetical protein
VTASWRKDYKLVKSFQLIAFVVHAIEFVTILITR